MLCIISDGERSNINNTENIHKVTLICFKWRLRNLFNQDYTLAIKTVTKTICIFLPNITHSGQTRFLKGGDIRENTFR